MAVRQYIGARYVPLFDGLWDSTKNYEPLTVVDDANGNSYTSRRDVPAGAPLTDRQYWIQTASFSGAIQQLQNRMYDAEQDIDALQDATGTLNTNLTNAQRVIGRVDGQLHLGGNYIFVSDSYANAEYGDMFTHLAYYLGLENSQWFDAHASGGSFATGEFLSTTRDVINNMTAEQKNQTFGVYVFAGINDAGGRQFSTIDTNIATFIGLIKEQLPNAEIGIGFVGNIVEPGSNSRNYEGRYVALRAYANCSKYGAKFYAGMENILHDYTLMSADGIHPNNDGALTIAMYAANAIRGGQTDVARTNRYSSVADITANFWKRGAEYISPTIRNVNLLPTPYASEVNALASQNNDFGHVELRGIIGIEFTSAMTLTIGNQFTIGQIIEPLWRGASAQFTIPIRGYYQTSGNDFGSFEGALLNFGGTLLLRINQVTDNWSANAQNVTAILFHGFEADVPTFVM